MHASLCADHVVCHSQSDRKIGVNGAVYSPGGENGTTCWLYTHSAPHCPPPRLPDKKTRAFQGRPPCKSDLHPRCIPPPPAFLAATWLAEMTTADVPMEIEDAQDGADEAQAARDLRPMADLLHAVKRKRKAKDPPAQRGMRWTALVTNKIPEMERQQLCLANVIRKEPLHQLLPPPNHDQQAAANPAAGGERRSPDAPPPAPDEQQTQETPPGGTAAEGDGDTQQTRKHRRVVLLPNLSRAAPGYVESTVSIGHVSRNGRYHASPVQKCLEPPRSEIDRRKREN